MLNAGRGFNDAFEEQIGLQAESKLISYLSFFLESLNCFFFPLVVYNTRVYLLQGKDVVLSTY